MINEYAFSSIIYALKSYNKGLNAFETGLGMHVNENYMVKIFDDIIEPLTDSFFSQEELEENISDVDGTHFAYCCNREFKDNWETINELIYHFCFNGDFGDRPEVLTERLVIKDNQGEDIESYDTLTAEQLYEVIVRFLNRINDSDETLTYYINCSSIK